MSEKKLRRILWLSICLVLSMIPFILVAEIWFVNSTHNQLETALSDCKDTLVARSVENEKNNLFYVRP